MDVMNPAASSSGTLASTVIEKIVLLQSLMLSGFAELVTI